MVDQYLNEPLLENSPIEGKGFSFETRISGGYGELNEQARKTFKKKYFRLLYEDVLKKYIGMNLQDNLLRKMHNELHMYFMSQLNYVGIVPEINCDTNSDNDIEQIYVDIKNSVPFYEPLISDIIKNKGSERARLIISISQDERLRPYSHLCRSIENVTIVDYEWEYTHDSSRGAMPISYAEAGSDDEQYYDAEVERLFWDTSTSHIEAGSDDGQSDCVKAESNDELPEPDDLEIQQWFEEATKPYHNAFDEDKIKMEILLEEAKRQLEEEKESK